MNKKAIESNGKSIMFCIFFSMVLCICYACLKTQKDIAKVIENQNKIMATQNVIIENQNKIMATQNAIIENQGQMISLPLQSSMEIFIQGEQKYLFKVNKNGGFER